MALNKSITLNNGVAVEYWKITQINVDYETKIVYIVLQGYLNQEIRMQENSEPIQKKFYSVIDKTIIEKYFDDSLADCLHSRAAGYKYIKENDTEFVDAVNC